MHQPALAELPRRHRPERNGVPTQPDSSDRSGTPDQLAEERRHRYLSGSREPDTTAVIDLGARDPNQTGRNPLVLADGGNTEPLIIRTPVDRSHPNVGSGQFGTDSEGRTEPASTAEGPSPGDLGLRPDSVARLGASGRELLARLQAELASGRTMFAPRAGGLSPNGGGGNGTDPHGKLDPPDLAG